MAKFDPSLDPALHPGAIQGKEGIKYNLKNLAEDIWQPYLGISRRSVSLFEVTLAIMRLYQAAEDPVVGKVRLLWAYLNDVRNFLGFLDHLFSTFGNDIQYINLRNCPLFICF